MSEAMKWRIGDILTHEGFARRVDTELEMLGYPEFHDLRVAARRRMGQDTDEITRLRGEVERLRKAGDNLANAVEHGIGLSDAVTAWDNARTNLDDDTSNRETADE